MPKLKTKSGAKKRFKLTGKGKLKRGNAFTSHMMMNKSKKMKRQAKRTSNVSEADSRIILRNFFPYGRKKKKTAAEKTATRKAGN